MGTVTGATYLDDQGRSCPRDLPPGTWIVPESGFVELSYAYGPSLFPPPSTAADGMWRYRDLLPLDAGPIRFPLPVGGTPLLTLPGLRSHSGLRHLRVKAETRSPSGSNKDRGTALVLEHAMRAGVHTVTAASTGNVAVSLAVGAAASGIRAVIFVPANVSPGKLRLMLATGATVLKVTRGYDEAFRLSRLAARHLGWADRNTGSNPLTVEAKKTVAFEIWEQLGRRVPDVIVIPVGDGTTLTAIWKGFREIDACLHLPHFPRLIGVQAEGCHPLECAFWGRDDDGRHETIAEGIRVTRPVNGMTALRDIRASGGAVVSVSDQSILEAIQVLSSRAGILSEPAAAAAYAALPICLERGLMSSDEHVVTLATGSGMKTPEYLGSVGEVMTIDQDPDTALRLLADRETRISI